MTVREIAWGLLVAAFAVGLISALPSREYTPRWHTPEGVAVAMDSLQVVAVPPDAAGRVVAVPVGWFGDVPYWCRGDDWVEVEMGPDGPCVLPAGRELRGYCDVELSSPEYTFTHGAPPPCE